MKTLLNHIGEPVFFDEDGLFLNNGVAYSPQNTLNPYECATPVIHWVFVLDLSNKAYLHKSFLMN